VQPDLLQIPQGLVLESWPLVSGHIGRAAQLGEYSEELLCGWCADGEAQLWLAWSDHCEAAAITRPIENGKVCLIAACGGNDVARWVNLLSGIEQWARENGCETMRLYGRPGWVRKLRDYKMTRIILDKKL
jgi:hypothetical protein